MPLVLSLDSLKKLLAVFFTFPFWHLILLSLLFLRLSSPSSLSLSPSIRCCRLSVVFVALCLTCGALELHQAFQVCSHLCWAKLLSSQLTLSLCKGLFLLSCKSLHFPSLNFMSSQLTSFSGLHTSTSSVM